MFGSGFEGDQPKCKYLPGLVVVGYFGKWITLLKLYFNKGTFFNFICFKIVPFKPFLSRPLFRIWSNKYSKRHFHMYNNIVLFVLFAVFSLLDYLPKCSASSSTSLQHAFLLFRQIPVCTHLCGSGNTQGLTWMARYLLSKRYDKQNDRNNAPGPKTIMASRIINLKTCLTTIITALPFTSVLKRGQVHKVSYEMSLICTTMNARKVVHGARFETNKSNSEVPYWFLSLVEFQVSLPLGP